MLNSQSYGLFEKVANNNGSNLYNNANPYNVDYGENTIGNHLQNHVANNVANNAANNAANNLPAGVGEHDPNDSIHRELDASVGGLNPLPNECYPKDILESKDLLPGDTSSTWAQSVPSGQGSIEDKNFLNAGFHVGTNTVGQSLRNANLQLRSEPPNPQVKVSPWLQSTIEPDINRRPLEST